MSKFLAPRDYLPDRSDDATTLVPRQANIPQKMATEYPCHIGKRIKADRTHAASLTVEHRDISFDHRSQASIKSTVKVDQFFRLHRHWLC